jgi:hypothetical protein
MTTNTEELKTLLRKVNNLRQPDALEAIESIHSETALLAEESERLEARLSEIQKRREVLDHQFRELCGDPSIELQRKRGEVMAQINCQSSVGVMDGIEKLFNRVKA